MFDLCANIGMGGVSLILEGSLKILVLIYTVEVFGDSIVMTRMFKVPYYTIRPERTCTIHYRFGDFDNILGITGPNRLATSNKVYQLFRARLTQGNTEEMLYIHYISPLTFDEDRIDALNNFHTNFYKGLIVPTRFTDWDSERRASSSSSSRGFKLEEVASHHGREPNLFEIPDPGADYIVDQKEFTT